MDPATLNGLDRAQLAALLRAAVDLLDEAAGEEDGPAPEQTLWKTAKAAERLDVHVHTLTRAAREGRVPGAQRVGTRSWRFDPSVLAILPAERPARARPVVRRAAPGRPARSASLREAFLGAA